MDSMGQVEDVNEEIRRLKAEGKSLRAIATALGVSHVAVLKRLKTMEIDREMVTNDDKTESVTKEKETLLTASNSRHSRESRGSKKVDNQVVTQRTLSPAKGEGGNLSGNPLIEAIAQRVSDILKPTLAHIERGDGREGGDPILDVKGLAEYFHVTPSWVYKKVSLKAIPYFKTGKYPRFRKKEIDKWIESQTARPIPALKVVKNRGWPADNESNSAKSVQSEP